MIRYATIALSIALLFHGCAEDTAAPADPDATAAPVTDVVTDTVSDPVVEDTTADTPDDVGATLDTSEVIEDVQDEQDAAPIEDTIEDVEDGGDADRQRGPHRSRAADRLSRRHA